MNKFNLKLHFNSIINRIKIIEFECTFFFTFPSNVYTFIVIIVVHENVLKRLGRLLVYLQILRMVFPKIIIIKSIGLVLFFIYVYINRSYIKLPNILNYIMKYNYIEVPRKYAILHNLYILYYRC